MATNTDHDAEAVERVDQAIDAVGWSQVEFGIIPDNIAESAIAAHTAYLWERADDPAVVEAVERQLWEMFEAREDINGPKAAIEAITATLNVLLGPRPEDAQP